MVDNAYTFDPVSWNGKSLTAAPFFKCYWDGTDPSPLTDPLEVDAIEAVVPGRGTSDVRGQPKAKTWLLTVELSSTLDSDLKSMLGVFNTEDGVVYLVVSDGQAAPVSWRVAARCLKHQRTDAPQIFKIPVRVADPRWQENTLTTDSQLNKQTSPVNFTLTNNGTRKTRPVFTIMADAAKTGATNDFGKSLQGFIVNKAPLDYNGPVYLFDSNGAQSRIDMSAIGLASGDDTRVWLDDVPDQARFMVNPHTASTDVVLPKVSLKAGGTYTLTAAMTNVSPANGGSFTVNEDISRLPVANDFVTIDTEVFYYASRAGRTFYGIRRAQWGTTAAAHSLGANVWGYPRRMIVGSAFSAILTNALYGAPPAPAAQRPAIQLPASSNQGYRWGDLTDDANSAFYDPANPDRSAQFVPSLIVTDDPAFNAYSMLMNSAGDATFQDSAQGSVQGTPANSLAIQIAQKIASGASGITYDCTLDPALALDIYGTALGAEQLLVERVGSGALTGQTITTPANLNGQVRVGVKHGVVVGTNTGDYGTVTATDTQPVAETFTLLQQTVIPRLAVRVQRGVGDMLLDLVPVNGDTNATLNLTNKLMTQATVVNANIPASMGWVFLDLSASPLTLAAGKYGIVITAATAGTGTVIVSRSNGSVYANGEARIGVVGTVNYTVTADWDGWVADDATGSQNPAGPTANLQIQGTGGGSHLRYAIFGFPVLAALCPALAVTDVIFKTTTSTIPVANDSPKFSAYVNTGQTNYGQDDPSADTLAQNLTKANYGRQTGGNRLYHNTGVVLSSSVGGLNTNDIGAAASNPQPSATNMYIVQDLKNALPLNRFTVVMGPAQVTGSTLVYQAGHNNSTPGYRPTMTVVLSEPATAAFGTVGAWDYGIRVYGSPQQTDSIVNTGGQSILGKLGINFDVSGEVFVHRVSGFGSTLFHCILLITNTTTGDTIQIDKWMAVGSTLQIDCENRSVIYTEDTVQYPVTNCCTFSNVADWMALAAGANAMTAVDASMAAPGQYDLVTTFRGVKT